jgi:hypothetical protein
VNEHIIGSSLMVKGTRNPSRSVLPAFPSECNPQTIVYENVKLTGMIFGQAFIYYKNLT